MPVELLRAAPNMVALPGPSLRETVYQCIRAANMLDAR
jgi:hypothetical protein